MSAVVYRPLHDWCRHYPTARAIAAELVAAPALLALRTKRLAVDIRGRFGCSDGTARMAVAFARRGNGRAAT